MSQEKPLDLETTCLRLREDNSAEKLPVTEQFWPDLMSGKLGDFHNEYLVLQLFFTENWPSWEVHPHGDEIVILIAGQATFILDTDKGEQKQTLTQPGQYVFVPSNTWHTADIDTATSMIFLTPGEGTVNKPRLTE